MKTDKIPTTAPVEEFPTAGEIHALSVRAAELRSAYLRSLGPVVKRGAAAAIRALVRDRLRHPAAV